MPAAQNALLPRRPAVRKVNCCRCHFHVSRQIFNGSVPRVSEFVLTRPSRKVKGGRGEPYQTDDVSQRCIECRRSCNSRCYLRIMVDIKAAVANAIQFAKNSLGPERTMNIRLEEI